jgi:Cu-Zn family superoxide dismutase
MKAMIPLAIAATFAVGCASMGQDSAPTAVANLEPTKDNSAKGTVTFTQVGDKVRVVANLSGLKAGSPHGFHVHEKGDCGSGDGMSAGGHYNPAAKPHGSLSTDHHAGDMPNVMADSYGNATVTVEIPGLTIGSGSADIVGKGLIVHRDPDDYKSQPAGNAGPRIACAVIRKS